MTSKNKLLIAANNIHRVIVEFGIAKKGQFKGKNSNSPNFSYQKIDDIYEFISPLMAEENILCFPYLIEEKETVVPTSTGYLIRSKVTVDYKFIHLEDSSFEIVRSIGEETDTGGKSTSKAMAVAHKIALKQMFLIPQYGKEQANNHTPSYQHTNQNIRSVDPETVPKQDIRTVHSEVEQNQKKKLISPGQKNWLLSHLESLGTDISRALKHYNINDFSQLPIDEYEPLRVRIIKSLEERKIVKP